MTSTDGLAVAVDAVLTSPMPSAVHQVKARVVAVRREVERLQAHVLSLVAVLAAAEGAPGGRATRTWLTSALGDAPGAASGAVRAAANLFGDDPAGTTTPDPDREAPVSATAAALAAGEITVDAARVLSGTLRQVTDRGLAGNDPGDLAGLERDLLAHAARVDVGKLRRHCELLLAGLDRVACEADARAAQVSRYLHVSARTGGVAYRGFAAGIDGAELTAALDAVTRPVPGPDGAPDPRDAGQRRADGLATLVRAATSNGVGTGQDAAVDQPGGQGRAEVLVTVDVDTLLAATGEPALPATTGTGGVLTPEQARQVACDAVLRPVLTRERGRDRVLGGTTGGSVPRQLLARLRRTRHPVGVGEGTRVVPPRLRAALVVRDTGCVMPGCGAPASWCDAHHVVHWAQGGPTVLENLVLLCRRHHTAVHHGDDHGQRWRITWREGTPTVEPTVGVTRSAGPPEWFRNAKAAPPGDVGLAPTGTAPSGHALR